jgi:hypothetical protein
VNNSSVTATKIANAAVGNAAIANASIDSAKVNSLDVSKLNAGTMTVGAGGMTFSGTGGIQISAGAALTNINSAGVVSPNIYALASSYGWNIIGGGTPQLDYVALFAGGYANFPSLRVGGTEVISSGRNGSFANLKCTGAFSPNYGTVGSTPTPANFTKFLYIYAADGTTIIGYVPIF